MLKIDKVSAAVKSYKIESLVCYQCLEIMLHVYIGQHKHISL